MDLMVRMEMTVQMEKMDWMVRMEQ